MLIWDFNPIPTIYCLTHKIPPSVYPTTSRSRKPPSVCHPSNDQEKTSIFIEKDEIHF